MTNILIFIKKKHFLFAELAKYQIFFLFLQTNNIIFEYW